MKFPAEHANKVLWLAKYMQQPKYMYGSKHFGWITYETQNPTIVLDKSQRAFNFICDEWIIDIWYNTNYLRTGKLWNNTVIESPHLSDNTRHEFTATYLGNLDNFIEVVTYLYFVNQD